jgi:hypothetical protein
MPLISAAAAPTFELAGITFTGLASPSRGSTQTCVWTLALDPGVTGEPHHLDQEEVFVAVAVLPVGGRASLGDGEYFVPPWAA